LIREAKFHCTSSTVRPNGGRKSKKKSVGAYLDGSERRKPQQKKTKKVKRGVERWGKGRSNL